MKNHVIEFLIIILSVVFLACIGNNKSDLQKNKETETSEIIKKRVCVHYSSMFIVKVVNMVLYKTYHGIDLPKTNNGFNIIVNYYKFKFNRYESII